MEKGGEKLKRSVVAGSEVVEIEVGQLPGYFERFAHSINVDHDTLLNWCKAHPEFLGAYKKAKEIQLAQMLDSALKGAYMAAPAIFALKNMHGWRDRQEVAMQHSGEVSLQASNELQKALNGSWNHLSLEQEVRNGTPRK